jgi:hypothetical protein
MSVTIRKTPQNEEELVKIRDFIDNAKQMNLDLQRRVNDVDAHLSLLDDYCMKYDEIEGQKFWNTKTLPWEIESDIGIGKSDIEQQEEIFMNKLELEKDKFTKSMTQFREDLDQIK